MNVHTRATNWTLHQESLSPGVVYIKVSCSAGVVYIKVSLSLQVEDWVEQHGEVFLNKHTGVGKSLHRARALQRRHDDFQQVAQVPVLPYLSHPTCLKYRSNLHL